MIKGFESLLHNCRFPSAQHVADNRTTADVRLHNSCCAADDTISFDNLSCLLRQLILSFPTTISVFSNRQTQYFQILSVFLSSFFLILRIIIYLCDVNQTITGDNKDILFLLT